MFEETSPTTSAPETTTGLLVPENEIEEYIHRFDGDLKVYRKKPSLPIGNRFYMALSRQDREILDEAGVDIVETDREGVILRTIGFLLDETGESPGFREACVRYLNDDVLPENEDWIDRIHELYPEHKV